MGSPYTAKLGNRDGGGMMGLAIRTERNGLARRAMRVALVCTLGLNLSACFRPLYGPTASGEPMAALLASVQVDEVNMAQGQERIGHYLRSELIFDLDGSGQPSTKRYRLKMQGSETVQTPIVSSQTGRAEAGTIIANVKYSLENLDGTKIISEGVATSTATYDRSVQRFASLRAARDAEIRLAKTLSEQIKTRLASVLVTKP